MSGLGAGLLACWLAVGHPAWGAEAARPAGLVQVHPDGSLEVNPAGGAFQPAGVEPGRPIRWDFGLPGLPPEQRALEDGSLPICRTCWTTHGIRYTQTVLMTRLGPGELWPGGAAPADAVVLVELKGENTASDYTEASAAFAVTVGDRRLDLELCGGLVRLAGARPPPVLAVVDVPAAGVAGTNGPALKFHGNMPPGTSGTMVLKIPAAKLAGEEVTDRLRDLEFEDELRRVKRYWTERSQTSAGGQPPVAFAEPTSAEPKK